MDHLVAETKKLHAEAAKLLQPEAVEGGPMPMSPKEIAELQLSYDKLEVELEVNQMKLQVAAIEATKREHIKMADIEARFALGQRADDTRRMIAQIEGRRQQITDGYMARLKAHELAQKEANLAKGFDTYG
jgi:hypothetical protein